MIREYRSIQTITSPLIVVKSTEGVTCGELAEVELENGSVRTGKVLEVTGDCAIVQFFENLGGVSPASSKVRFLGRPLELAVSGDMLGRVFNGLGKPLDGGPEIMADEYMDINGSVLSPALRELPAEFIQTGVSAIDGLCPLVRGQTLSVFSGAGLPHARLTAQIMRQAKLLDEAASDFAIVFASIGLTFDESEYFVQELNKTGAMSRSVIFSNLACDPSNERFITPRLALTAAEYLAFKMNLHVLVIMADMTSYADALREISAARHELPGLYGYPNYLNADFASIYERAGCRLGKKGSITLLPILTMPEDDKTHPVPDMAGYASEGQIYLSRELHRNGISPPIDVLNSLSRRGFRAVGADKTREDHAYAARQLLSAYSAGREAGELSAVLGECALSKADLTYAKFAEEFEKRFISQGYDENRPVADTLKLVWELLSSLPKSRLTRLKPEYLEKYLLRHDSTVE